MFLIDCDMANVGLFLFLVGFLTQNSESRSHKTRNAGRIFNGLLGEQTNFPFLVSVQKRSGREDDPNGAWESYCSGTIVSQWNVLTACHAIAQLDVLYTSFNEKAARALQERRNPRQTASPKVLSWKQLRVYAGSGNNMLEQVPTSQYRYASQLIPHPNCEVGEGSYIRNDVGVIKLRRPFDYNVRVQPIAVPSLDPDEALNTARDLQAQQVTCQAAGWGDTEDEVNHPHNLFWYAEVQLVASDHCWGKFDIDHYACTISQSQSMCRGDSGGPLVCQGYLLGLHSSSRCQPGYINYMANIEPIVYMINNHVVLDPPGGKRGVQEEGQVDPVFVHPEGPNIHGGGGRTLG